MSLPMAGEIYDFFFFKAATSGVVKLFGTLAFEGG